MTITIHKNFLKEGDPAFTHPWGKSYSPLHPNGVPNRPYPNDPQAERDWLVRDWFEQLSRVSYNAYQK